VSPEIEAIVSAIKSLKQETGYFRDYLFPIASAFFSSILGAGIAYFVLRDQEDIQIEKDKMNSTNKWTLLAEQARANLIAIKSNYHGKLSNIPFQRLATVPTVLFQASPINETYQNLSFIAPKAAGASIKYNKWSQIPRINAMISNYNYLLKLWEQRNTVYRPVIEELFNKHSKNGYLSISQEEAISLVGGATISSLIDLTERVLKLTDDLLLELTDFLTEFPEYAKQIIRVKRLKRYGSVLTYLTEENSLLLAQLERVPEVDFESVLALFGRNPDEMKEKYKTGYE